DARKAMTEELIDVYDNLKAAAKEDAKDTTAKMQKKYSLTAAETASLLAILCDDRQYPTPEGIRQSFDVVTRYYDYNVPARLGEVNQEAFVQAQAQFNEECALLYGEVRDALRGAFNGLVTHMVDRLGYEEDGKRAGKKKIFGDSMVDKMEDFLKTFEARNLTNDGDLKALVDKARKVMKGVNANDLRNLDSVRSSVSKQFEALKKEMDKNIVIKSTRKFSFAATGDEE